QWVPDHELLYPRIFEHVGAGGALAVQVPAGFDALPHRLMRELAPPDIHVKQWHSHEPAFYYRVLAPHAARVDIWQTEYQHVMLTADAIVEWYKGTGLRPFLEAMSADQRETFSREYIRRIRDAYRPEPDGRVLFPFLRLFLVAYKPSG